MLAARIVRLIATWVLTFVKLFDSRLMSDVISKMLVMITKMSINGGPRMGEICRDISVPGPRESSRMPQRGSTPWSTYLSHGVLVVQWSATRMVSCECGMCLLEILARNSQIRQSSGIRSQVSPPVARIRITLDSCFMLTEPKNTGEC